MKAPNIVFCHADEWNHGVFSGLGNPHVATPCLDEIMHAGTTFTRAQSMNPLCAPCRTSWYTGRMPSEHGTFNNDLAVNPALPDLGQWMGARGFDPYFCGKWHLIGRDCSASFKVLRPTVAMGEQADEACAAMAEQFLGNYKGDKPFFLNVGFINPHDCCSMMTPSRMPCLKFGLEHVIADELPPLPPAYDSDRPIFPPKGVPHYWNAGRVQLYNYMYNRMVEAVDNCIGRVFHAVQSSRFAENTIFIFTSDHGEMLGNHNRFGKNVLWEDSLRVPLTIVAPGRIAANVRRDVPTAGLDTTATILDYAGVEPTPGLTIGRSLRPILEDKQTKLHDYLAAESTADGPHVSIRADDFKSITNLHDHQISLYNTAADPFEQHDLAADSRSASLVSDHRAMLADYHARITPSAGYAAIVADPSTLQQGGE